MDDIVLLALVVSNKEFSATSRSFPSDFSERIAAVMLTQFAQLARLARERTSFFGRGAVSTASTTKWKPNVIPESWRNLEYERVSERQLRFKCGTVISNNNRDPLDSV
jgi:hypothetical protein